MRVAGRQRPGVGGWAGRHMVELPPRPARQTPALASNAQGVSASVTTTRMDMCVYVFLALVIGLGLAETIGRNTLGGGYDYRATVGVWFRSIVFLHPKPSAMVGAPTLYQGHS